MVVSARSSGSWCRTKKFVAPFSSVLPVAVTICAGELVPGRVGFDLVANPGVVGPHRPAWRQLVAVDQQQVGPFVGPVVDELGPRQAALRSACRACPRDVSARNARVSSAVGSTPIVSRYARRRNSASLAGGDGGMFRLASLCQHQLVDEVAPRRCGETPRRRPACRTATLTVATATLLTYQADDRPFAVPD